MKKTRTCIVTIALAFALLVAWKLQFWLPAGTAFLLASEHFASEDYEIWQRKNHEVFEPFATALFVHDRASGVWTAYCLDIQDTYQPPYSMRKAGAEIQILRGRTHVWTYETATHTLRRVRTEMTQKGIVIGSNAPGKWWLN